LSAIDLAAMVRRLRLFTQGLPKWGVFNRPFIYFGICIFARSA
jgi:hypothetical protein